MKRLIAAGGLLALLLVGCGETASELYGTRWTFFGYEAGGGVVDVLPGTDPTLEFAEDENTLSGSDGCNDFTGSYELSSGNMITIGPLASTRKACPDDVMAQADQILAILSEVILYEKVDDQLIMRTQDVRYLGYDRFDDSS